MSLIGSTSSSGSDDSSSKISQVYQSSIPLLVQLAEGQGMDPTDAMNNTIWQLEGQTTTRPNAQPRDIVMTVAKEFMVAATYFAYQQYANSPQYDPGTLYDPGVSTQDAMNSLGAWEKVNLGVGPLTKAMVTQFFQDLPSIVNGTYGPQP